MTSGRTWRHLKSLSWREVFKHLLDLFSRCLIYFFVYEFVPTPIHSFRRFICPTSVDLGISKDLQYSTDMVEERISFELIPHRTLCVRPCMLDWSFSYRSLRFSDVVFTTTWTANFVNRKWEIGGSLQSLLTQVVTYSPVLWCMHLYTKPPYFSRWKICFVYRCTLAGFV